MASLQCKMCGGTLLPQEDGNIAVCDSCGLQQTVPNADDEKKLLLFDRAENLRRQCEFDKAYSVYENIVAEFPREAEAYWGLVLCKYGIEYVEDPASGKAVPTCHRISTESVLEDVNYEQACENTDSVTRRQYREDARLLDEIRGRSIAVSANEEPYDIFICYKETDRKGNRTEDSLMAEKIYNMLTEKDYRVFFSRITLEDKLGVEYEPYIFAALNSARVMLVIGSDYDHFHAVWVRNEWSRFLKLMEKDHQKHLIPCYKDIDPYDLPKEFKRIQAQNMNDLGAELTLLRGIEKMIPRKKETVQQVIVQSSGGGESNKVASILHRGNLALEDGEWRKADGFFEEVLNNDSQNALAYLGKVLAQEQCSTLDKLVKKRQDSSADAAVVKLNISRNTGKERAIVGENHIENYTTLAELDRLFGFNTEYTSTVAARTEQLQKEKDYWAQHKLLARVEQFADADLAKKLREAKEQAISTAEKRLKTAEEQYQAGKKRKEEEYAAFLVKAENQAKAIHDRGAAKREADYQTYSVQVDPAIANKDYTGLLALIEAFQKIGSYKDSRQLEDKCRRATKAIADERAQLEAEFRREQEKRARKKRNTIIAAIIAVLAAVATVLVLLFTVIIPSSNYSKAEALFDAGDYVGASEQFLKSKSYKDSEDRAYACAEALTAEGKLGYAAICFGKLGDFQDADQRSRAIWNQIANRSYCEEGNYGGLAAVKQDGTVIIEDSWLDDASEPIDVGAITNAVAVACCGDEDIIILRDDGTVTVLCNRFTDCSIKKTVEKWTGIVDIAAGYQTVLGLKKDGTIVADASREISSQYKKCKNVVDIVCGYEKNTMAAILADGTVWLDTDGFEEEAVDAAATWTDIVDLDVGAYTVAGLCSDGTVVAYVDEIYDDALKATEWTNVKEIACGDSDIYALTNDGELLVTDFTREGWENIATIECTYEVGGTLIGINKDGVMQSSEMDDADYKWVGIKIGEKEGE